MEAIIRNVRDIENDERRVLEHVVGQKLRENQQVIIQVVTLAADAAEEPAGTSAPSATQLPDWCNIYQGLTDQEVAELDAVIRQRADLTRPSA